MKEKKKSKTVTTSLFYTKAKATPPPLVLSLLKNHFSHTFFIVLLSVIVYGNTLFNKYALDDGMVLTENRFVQQGIAGIPDILTHDSFYGAISDTKYLAGGRYRPLAQIAYAIELSVFEKNTHIHHLFNIIFFAVTAMILLLFLRRFIFPDSPVAAFIATLLFVTHPVHTEVVANIKSRDEIFSLLFLLLTLYFMLKHVLISKKSRHRGISVLCYIMALLSKENGLAFVILIPLTLYFITKEKFIVILKLSAPYVMVAVTYIAVRIMMIGINNNEVTEVMDNPYVLASLSEKYATLLLVFLKYIQLLIFPHPLTYDYSFNQIPYRNFSDMWVLFSLFLHLLMVIFVVLNFKKKDILAWCILLYAGSIFLVSNIAFNIGAPMAERFLFQPSVAFVIFLVELWRRFVDRGLLNYQGFSSLTFIILIPAIIISCYAAIKRNQVWQSDEVLFLTDVKTSYGSARANTYAGVALIRLCDRSKNPQLKQDYALDALDYFRRSLQIKSDYITTLLNMGVAYSRLDSVEEAEAVWNYARAVNPNDKNFIVYDRYLAESFYKQGLKAGVNKDFQVAIINLENSLEYEPVNVEGWYNLGGAYYSIKQYTEAKSCWEKTLQLNPKHEQAALGLEALLEIGY